jgi:CheY-like chemotaxis protein
MRIIIADDYYTNRLLVSEILVELGHECIEAENGQQVLHVLETNNDIDLVLMDIEMPVMNGVEAMHYIRENLLYPKNSVPIIALTAHSFNALNEDFSGEGFNRTLVKPYSIDKIAELLKTFAGS